MPVKTLLLVVLTSLILLAGCRATAPVQNISDTTITNIQGERPSAQQTRDAIRRAGAALGWQMSEAGSGTLEGRLALRDHLAIVEIPYAAGQYSIRYKDSRNLNYQNGEIHPNYNSWIRNLDNQIRAQISAL